MVSWWYPNIHTSRNVNYFQHKKVYFLILISHKINWTDIEKKPPYLHPIYAPFAVKSKGHVCHVGNHVKKREKWKQITQTVEKVKSLLKIQFSHILAFFSSSSGWVDNIFPLIELTFPRVNEITRTCTFFYGIKQDVGIFFNYRPWWMIWLPSFFEDLLCLIKNFQQPHELVDQPLFNLISERHENY